MTNYKTKEEAIADNQFNVGDGATEYMYSDREAYTVVEVNKAGTKAVIQRDEATIDSGFKPDFQPGGFVGHCSNQNAQTYSYKRNPNSSTNNISLRVWYNEYNFSWYARWVLVGQKRSSGTWFGKGRHKFYDYNF